VSEPTDVVIVGGGHNGLTSAAYLARSGLRVTILEQADQVGGAAISAEAFPGVPARLSRYSYLVSLMPSQIIRDLNLSIDLRSRAVASFTPLVRQGHATGLLVEREPGAPTEESFRSVTGSTRDFTAWIDFYERIARAAAVLAPTMLEPLPSRDEARAKVVAVAGARTWEQIAEIPLGETLMETFEDDDVRGIVATDGLIGTYSSLFDAGLLQNRCFLYHLVGDGTGEWKVPAGGMGAVSSALASAASGAGARIATGATVTAIHSDGHAAEVVWIDAQGAEHRTSCRWVLANTAPATLDHLLGRPPTHHPRGAQMKVNMLLTRLPRLRSGIDPATAFAGTLHIGESMTAIEASYAEGVSGRLPSTLPCEIYCHTLTDPSILGPELQQAGWHTMTLFGLHTPSDLFTPSSNDVLREQALRQYVEQINGHLDEPLEDCLALDANGDPCIEAKTPLDLQESIGLPGGNIFHRDLRWPWAPQESERPDSRPGAWGVETDIANVLVCGAGARRGGGVSGLPGRWAAMAVLADH
jgi:phytoene dehydrogenase-like protein